MNDFSPKYEALKSLYDQLSIFTAHS
uniref:Uncharacterized protein n=1 Tax=Arundo donax TaxID=35708 RepID=A0A0A8ZAF4_ARUDO